MNTNTNMNKTNLSDYALLHEKYNVNYTKYTNIHEDKLKNIHQSLLTMSNDEIINLYTQFVSIDYLKHELFLLDLEHNIPDKQNNITKDEFINYVHQLFNYYHNPLFGNLFEDNVWKFHDKTSTKYPLKDNEIIFENSISLVDEFSEENEKVDDYIRLIRKHLNKLSDNIKVSDKIIEDNHNEISWILLKCNSDLFI